MDWSHYFVYDENSGNLIWKVKPSAKVKIGSIAGHLDHDGYISVKLHKHTHPAHCIIWEMHNGPIPVGYEVDHLDHIRSNNKLNNLRLVTRKENQRNQKLHKRNTSGFSGIYWEKAINKWRVRIMGNNGKSLSFGCFNNKDDAIAARNKAYADLGYHDNHGVSHEVNQ
ncbi:HNH endonuclease signature motif containing protein [Escherichia coli]|uniref:HNH endonuclease signature motif containing protein n=1 Tax=Escherichia coli TaxID=562 RepID=UPI000BE1C43E|nr:HNH endonuclease signature motif containing protein [Escherichia coli]